MTLSAKSKSQLARLAANANAKKRRTLTEPRDIGIFQAYRRLQGINQSNEADTAGVLFLHECGFSPNLPPGETVWSYLSRVSCLTKRRIRQIVEKFENNEANLARIPAIVGSQPDLFFD